VFAGDDSPVVEVERSADSNHGEGSGELALALADKFPRLDFLIFLFLFLLLLFGQKWVVWSEAFGSVVFVTVSVFEDEDFEAEVDKLDGADDNNEESNEREEIKIEGADVHG